MRIAPVGLAIAVIASAITAAAAEPSKGLSLEQIRAVMRANAAAFDACLTAARRRHRQLHGPFVYEIAVDKQGKVTAARPFAPSGVAAFDRCAVGVLMRARFPGGPASIETPLVFEPS